MVLDGADDEFAEDGEEGGGGGEVVLWGAIVDGCGVDDGDAAWGVGEDVFEVFDFMGGENEIFIVFEFNTLYFKDRCGDAKFGEVDEGLGLLWG